MVKEDDKYYIIIKALKDPVKESYDQELFYLYGKQLLESGGPLVEEYLLREERLKEQVEESLRDTDTAGSNKRLEEIRRDLALIHAALNYFNN